MKIHGEDWKTLWELPDASGIEVIDQRWLPHRFETAELRSAEEVGVAIREMYVRGAPLIGAAAGYGVYLAALRAPDREVDSAVASAAELLTQTRPTAVNLRWAVQRVVEELQTARSPGDLRQRALTAARRIVAEELERSRRIGEEGLRLIQRIAERNGGQTVRILTHCNAGWLATIDFGTATAPIYEAHEHGIGVHVWIDETRPRNQGAALTAYELGEHGVPHAVVVDNAGGHLMQQGMVDLVIVGADRVASNGDTANKIGTYLKALAAHDNGVPFYVALPSSTIDWSLQSGREIPIEERSEEEVRYIHGLGERGPERVLLVPPDTPARNFGFDVTPARLITGFITEHGVCSPSDLGAVMEQR